jgi:hypothetical protein
MGEVSRHEEGANYPLAEATLGANLAAGGGASLRRRDLRFCDVSARTDPLGSVQVSCKSYISQFSQNFD